MSYPVGIDVMLQHMGGENEIWLVSGGQPGAERFGQFVQGLRKENHISVVKLADDANLSVGTIRAIEQGRRAPSEESGLRILQLLLPEGSLVKGALDGEHPGLSCSFNDPRSGTRILLEFGARTAGDNRRWSSDKPPVGESKAEAFVRELMDDPIRSAALVDNLRPVLQTFASTVAEIQRRAELPASDAAFGRIMRRLAYGSEFRFKRLTILLDLWDSVESGGADDWVERRTSEINSLLDAYQFIDDDDSGVDAP